MKRLILTAMIACVLCLGLVISETIWNCGSVFAFESCENDLDCDGLPDDREDFDGDGEIDIDVGETDPENPDSDGDGLTDGEERLHGGRVGELIEGRDFYFKALDRLDPNNPDSDRDCITDGVELGVTKADAQSIVSRMRRKKKYLLSQRCLAIMSDNRVSDIENAVPYDAEIPVGKNNIGMLYDAEPETLTDPTDDDSDADGVIDGAEDFNFNGMRDSNEAGWVEMDPLLSDSDGDGMIDGDEGDRDGDGELGANESDPLSSDTDGDGITDGEEARIGTELNICDTDSDGLSDGIEMGRIQPVEKDGCHGLQAAGTNYKKPNALDPLNPDSDGDGLADGEEDYNGNGWIDPADSDPSIVDTDGDGLGDGTEALGDFDGDGVPDFDIRFIEGGKDCSPPEDVSDIDCDGVPNNRDDDSDNDGCADEIEGGWLDANANGIPDVYDKGQKVCPDEPTDSGSGGTPSVAEDEEREYVDFYPTDGNDGGACQIMVGEVGIMHAIPPFAIICFLLVTMSLRRRKLSTSKSIIRRYFC